MSEVKLEALTLDALRAAVQVDGECRLLTKPGAKGLLPGGSVTAAKKAAITQCLDEDFGLFTKIAKQEKSGKSAAEVIYVVITTEGMNALLSSVSPEECGRILKNSAEAHKRHIKSAFIEVMSQKLAESKKKRDAAREAERELVNEWRKLVGGIQGEIVQERQRLEHEIREIELLAEIQHAPIEDLENKPKRRRVVEPLKATTEPEDYFQLKLCKELAYTWVDEPQSRQALERTMVAAGLKPAGKIGERVKFDGRYHDTVSEDVDISPDDPAEVVLPGWEHNSLDGKPYLIVKTTVKPLNPS